MTKEELQAIVAEVVSEINRQGVTVAKTEVKDSLNGVQYLCGLNGGNMVRLAAEIVTKGDAELLKRIQGTSENSDSRNDPSKVLGLESYANPYEGYADDAAFNAALDALLYDRNVIGGNQGFFRTRLRWCEVEIQNIILSNALDTMNIVQVIKGLVKIDPEGKIAKDHSGAYSILSRHYNAGAWGNWRVVATTQ